MRASGGAARLAPLAETAGSGGGGGGGGDDGGGGGGGGSGQRQSRRPPAGTGVPTKAMNADAVLTVKTLRSAAVRRALSTTRCGEGGGGAPPSVQALLAAWGVLSVTLSGPPPSPGAAAPSLTLADALASPTNARLPVPLDSERLVVEVAAVRETPRGELRGNVSPPPLPPPPPPPPPPLPVLDEERTSLHWALVDAAAVVALADISSSAAAVSSANGSGGGRAGGEGSAASTVPAMSAAVDVADAVSALERLFPHAPRPGNGGDASAGAMSSPGRLGALFSHASLLGLVGSATVSASPWWGSASGDGGGLALYGRGSVERGVLFPASPPLLVFGSVGAAATLTEAAAALAVGACSGRGSDAVGLLDLSVRCLWLAAASADLESDVAAVGDLGGSAGAHDPTAVGVRRDATVAAMAHLLHAAESIGAAAAVAPALEPGPWLAAAAVVAAAVGGVLPPDGVRGLFCAAFGGLTAPPMSAAAAGFDPSRPLSLSLSASGRPATEAALAAALVATNTCGAADVLSAAVTATRQRSRGVHPQTADDLVARATRLPPGGLAVCVAATGQLLRSTAMLTPPVVLAAPVWTTALGGEPAASDDGAVRERVASALGAYVERADRGSVEGLIGSNPAGVLATHLLTVVRDSVACVAEAAEMAFAAEASTPAMSVDTDGVACNTPPATTAAGGGGPDSIPVTPAGGPTSAEAVPGGPSSLGSSPHGGMFGSLFVEPPSPAAQPTGTTGRPRAAGGVRRLTSADALARSRREAAAQAFGVAALGLEALETVVGLGSPLTATGAVVLLGGLFHVSVTMAGGLVHSSSSVGEGGGGGGCSDPSGPLASTSTANAEAAMASLVALSPLLERATLTVLEALPPVGIDPAAVVGDVLDRQAGTSPATAPAVVIAALPAASAAWATTVLDWLRRSCPPASVGAVGGRLVRAYAASLRDLAVPAAIAAARSDLSLGDMERASTAAFFLAAHGLALSVGRGPPSSSGDLLGTLQHFFGLLAQPSRPEPGGDGAPTGVAPLTMDARAVVALLALTELAVFLFAHPQRAPEVARAARRISATPFGPAGGYSRTGLASVAGAPAGAFSDWVAVLLARWEPPPLRDAIMDGTVLVSFLRAASSAARAADAVCMPLWSAPAGDARAALGLPPGDWADSAKMASEGALRLSARLRAVTHAMNGADAGDGETGTAALIEGRASMAADRVHELVDDLMSGTFTPALGDVLTAVAGLHASRAPTVGHAVVAEALTRSFLHDARVSGAMADRLDTLLAPSQLADLLEVVCSWATAAGGATVARGDGDLPTRSAVDAAAVLPPVAASRTDALRMMCLIGVDPRSVRMGPLDAALDVVCVFARAAGRGAVDTATARTAANIVAGLAPAPVRETLDAAASSQPPPSQPPSLHPQLPSPTQLVTHPSPPAAASALSLLVHWVNEHADAAGAKDVDAYAAAIRVIAAHGLVRAVSAAAAGTATLSAWHGDLASLTTAVMRSVFCLPGEVDGEYGTATGVDGQLCSTSAALDADLRSLLPPPVSLAPTVTAALRSAAGRVAPDGGPADGGVGLRALTALIEEAPTTADANVWRCVVGTALDEACAASSEALAAPFSALIAAVIVDNSCDGAATALQSLFQALAGDSHGAAAAVAASTAVVAALRATDAAALSFDNLRRGVEFVAVAARHGSVSSLAVADDLVTLLWELLVALQRSESPRKHASEADAAIGADVSAEAQEREAGAAPDATASARRREVHLLVSALDTACRAVAAAVRRPGAAADSSDGGRDSDKDGVGIGVDGGGTDSDDSPTDDGFASPSHTCSSSSDDDDSDSLTDMEEAEELAAEAALAARCCTFTTTGSEFVEQHWYFCYTCGLSGSEGVCGVCARVCHAGHEVAYSRLSRFFCDCSAVAAAAAAAQAAALGAMPIGHQLGVGGVCGSLSPPPPPPPPPVRAGAGSVGRLRHISSLSSRRNMPLHWSRMGAAAGGRLGGGGGGGRGGDGSRGGSAGGDGGGGGGGPPAPREEPAALGGRSCICLEPRPPPSLPELRALRRDRRSLRRSRQVSAAAPGVVRDTDRGAVAEAAGTARDLHKALAEGASARRTDARRRASRVAQAWRHDLAGLVAAVDALFWGVAAEAEGRWKSTGQALLQLTDASTVSSSSVCESLLSTVQSVVQGCFSSTSRMGGVDSASAGGSGSGGGLPSPSLLWPDVQGVGPVIGTATRLTLSLFTHAGSIRGSSTSALRRSSVGVDLASGGGSLLVADASGRVAAADAVGRITLATLPSLLALPTVPLTSTGIESGDGGASAAVASGGSSLDRSALQTLSQTEADFPVAGLQFHPFDPQYLLLHGDTRCEVWKLDANTGRVCGRLGVEVGVVDGGGRDGDNRLLSVAWVVDAGGPIARVLATTRHFVKVFDLDEDALCPSYFLSLPVAGPPPVLSVATSSGGETIVASAVYPLFGDGLDRDEADSSLRQARLAGGMLAVLVLTSAGRIFVATPSDAERGPVDLALLVDLMAPSDERKPSTSSERSRPVCLAVLQCPRLIVVSFENGTLLAATLNVAACRLERISRFANALPGVTSRSLRPLPGAPGHLLVWSRGRGLSHTAVVRFDGRDAVAVQLALGHIGGITARVDGATVVLPTPALDPAGSRGGVAVSSSLAGSAVSAASVCLPPRTAVLLLLDDGAIHRLDVTGAEVGPASSPAVDVATLLRGTTVTARLGLRAKRAARGGARGGSGGQGASHVAEGSVAEAAAAAYGGYVAIPPVVSFFEQTRSLSDGVTLGGDVLRCAGGITAERARVVLAGGGAGASSTLVAPDPHRPFRIKVHVDSRGAVVVGLRIQVGCTPSSAGRLPGAVRVHGRTVGVVLGGRDTGRSAGSAGGGGDGGGLGVRRWVDLPLTVAESEISPRDVTLELDPPATGSSGGAFGDGCAAIDALEVHSVSATEFADRLSQWKTRARRVLAERRVAEEAREVDRENRLEAGARLRRRRGIRRLPPELACAGAALRLLSAPGLAPSSSVDHVVRQLLEASVLLWAAGGADATVNVESGWLLLSSQCERAASQLLLTANKSNGDTHSVSVDVDVVLRRILWDVTTKVAADQLERLSAGRSLASPGTLAVLLRLVSHAFPVPPDVACVNDDSARQVAALLSTLFSALGSIGRSQLPSLLAAADALTDVLVSWLQADLASASGRSGDGTACGPSAALDALLGLLTGHDPTLRALVARRLYEAATRSLPGVVHYSPPEDIHGVEGAHGRAKAALLVGSGGGGVSAVASTDRSATGSVGSGEDATTRAGASVPPPNPSPWAYRCDRCNQLQRSEWWHCTSCPDFDLCTACVRLPDGLVPPHLPSHVLLRRTAASEVADEDDSSGGGGTGGKGSPLPSELPPPQELVSAQNEGSALSAMGFVHSLLSVLLPGVLSQVAGVRLLDGAQLCLALTLFSCEESATAGVSEAPVASAGHPPPVDTGADAESSLDAPSASPASSVETLGSVRSRLEVVFDGFHPLLAGAADLSAADWSHPRRPATQAAYVRLRTLLGLVEADVSSAACHTVELLYRGGVLPRLVNQLHGVAVQLAADAVQGEANGAVADVPSAMPDANDDVVSGRSGTTDPAEAVVLSTLPTASSCLGVSFAPLMAGPPSVAARGCTTDSGTVVDSVFGDTVTSTVTELTGAVSLEAVCITLLRIMELVLPNYVGGANAEDLRSSVVPALCLLASLQDQEKVNAETRRGSRPERAAPEATPPRAAPTENADAPDRSLPSSTVTCLARRTLLVLCHHDEAAFYDKLDSAAHMRLATELEFGPAHADRPSTAAGDNRSLAAATAMGAALLATLARATARPVTWRRVSAYSPRLMRNLFAFSSRRSGGAQVAALRLVAIAIGGAVDGAVSPTAGGSAALSLERGAGPSRNQGSLPAPVSVAAPADAATVGTASTATPLAPVDVVVAHLDALFGDYVLGKQDAAARAAAASVLVALLERCFAGDGEVAGGSDGEEHGEAVLFETATSDGRGSSRQALLALLRRKMLKYLPSAAAAGKLGYELLGVLQRAIVLGRAAPGGPELDAASAFEVEAAQLLVSLTELCGRFLTAHPNAHVYKALASAITLDGYFLESEPCLTCSASACGDVAPRPTRVDILRLESKFTESALLYRLSAPQSVAGVAVSIVEPRGRRVRRVQVYTSPRFVSDGAELKRQDHPWRLVAVLALGPTQTEAKVDLPVAVVASNVKVAFTDFHPSADGSGGLGGGGTGGGGGGSGRSADVSGERLQCPRCSRPVNDRHGICRNCHENAYQCRQCRNINYEHLDAFLCNECGFCKYGRFDFTLVASPSFAAEQVENEADRLRASAVIEEETASVYRRYESLTALRAALVRVIASPELLTAEGAEALVDAGAASQTPAAGTRTAPRSRSSATPATTAGAARKSAAATTASAASGGVAATPWPPIHLGSPGDDGARASEAAGLEIFLRSPFIPMDSGFASTILSAAGGSGGALNPAALEALLGGRLDSLSSTAALLASLSGTGGAAEPSTPPSLRPQRSSLRRGDRVARDAPVGGRDRADGAGSAAPPPPSGSSVAPASGGSSSARGRGAGGGPAATDMTPGPSSVSKHVALLASMYGGSCKDAFITLSRGVRTLLATREELVRYASSLVQQGTPGSVSATESSSTFPLSSHKALMDAPGGELGPVESVDFDQDLTSRSMAARLLRCYGCAQSFMARCLPLVLDLSRHSAAARSVFLARHLAVHLLSSSAVLDSAAAQDAARQLVALLCDHDLDTTVAVGELISKKLDFCIDSHASLDIAIAARGELAALEALAVAVGVAGDGAASRGDGKTGDDDDRASFGHTARAAEGRGHELWEMRLRLVLRLLFRAADKAASSCAVAEHIILPCVRAASHLVGAGSVGGDGLSCAGPDGPCADESGAEEVEAGEELPAKEGVDYRAWASGRQSYADWLERNCEPSSEGDRAGGDPVVQLPLDSDAILGVVDGSSASTSSTSGGAVSSSSVVGGDEFGDDVLAMTGKKSWVLRLLFETPSSAVRQETASLVESLIGDNETLALRLLTTLTAPLTLREVVDVGERSLELFELVTRLLAPRHRRRYLATHDFLSRLASLIEEEAVALRDGELTRCDSRRFELSHGFVLHRLVLLLRQVLSLAEEEPGSGSTNGGVDEGGPEPKEDEDDVEDAEVDVSANGSVASSLLGGVLVGATLRAYLAVRCLVARRTRLTDECAAVLSELLSSRSLLFRRDGEPVLMACVVELSAARGQSVAVLVEQLCGLLWPEEVRSSVPLLLTKAPSQEEFIRGSMSRSPYDSAEVGELMRDVKNRICRDLDLAGLLDDDFGMELLVAGNLIKLDLPIAAVYRNVWLPAVMAPALTAAGRGGGGGGGSRGRHAAFPPAGVRGRRSGRGRPAGPASAGASPVLGSGGGVALGRLLASPGVAAGGPALATDRPRRGDRAQPGRGPSPHDSEHPMMVVFRLTGLDGEATEPIIESLQNPEEEGGGVEVEAVEAFARAGGVATLLTVLRGVTSWDDDSERAVREPALRILRACCEVGAACATLAATAGAVGMLLDCAAAALASEPGEAAAEALLLAAEKILAQDLEEDVLEPAAPVAQDGVVGSTSLEGHPSSSSLDGSSAGAADVVGSGTVEDLGRRRRRQLESSSVLDEREVVARLERFLAWLPVSSARASGTLLHVLPHLMRGLPSAVDAVVAHFRTHLVWGELNISARAAAAASQLAALLRSAPADSRGRALRRAVATGPDGVAARGVAFLAAAFPFPKAEHEAAWEASLCLPGPPLALELLAGAGDTCGTAIETLLPTLVALERTASSSAIGSRAEDVLESLMSAPALAAQVKAVRDEARAARRAAAMAARAAVLRDAGIMASGPNSSRLTAASLGSASPSGGIHPRLPTGVAASPAGSPMVSSSQLPRHTSPSARAAAASLSMDALADAVEDEVGPSCVVCGDGFRSRPEEALAVYAYTKRVALVLPPAPPADPLPPPATSTATAASSAADPSPPASQASGRLPGGPDSTSVATVASDDGSESTADTAPESYATSSVRSSSVATSPPLHPLAGELVGGRGAAAATPDAPPSSSSSMAASASTTSMAATSATPSAAAPVAVFAFTSVTHWNAVHPACHREAARAARSNRASRDEWEDAALRNSQTRCNNLIPLRPPAAAASADTGGAAGGAAGAGGGDGDGNAPAVTPAVRAAAAASYSTSVDFYFGRLPALARSGLPQVKLALHELSAALMRFAGAEVGVFSADARGGGAHSNAALLLPLMQLASHVMDRTGGGRSHARALSTYLASPGGDAAAVSVTAAAGGPLLPTGGSGAAAAASSPGATAPVAGEGLAFHLALSLLVHPPDAWAAAARPFADAAGRELGAPDHSGSGGERLSRPRARALLAVVDRLQRWLKAPRFDPTAVTSSTAATAVASAPADDAEAWRRRWMTAVGADEATLGALADDLSVYWEATVVAPGGLAESGMAAALAANATVGYRRAEAVEEPWRRAVCRALDP
ncbi:hypothetical protein MMPV_003850 [Pyropia vietnamensis]